MYLSFSGDTPQFQNFVKLLSLLMFYFSNTYFSNFRNFESALIFYFSYRSSSSENSRSPQILDLEVLHAPYRLDYSSSFLEMLQIGDLSRRLSSSRDSLISILELLSLERVGTGRFKNELFYFLRVLDRLSQAFALFLSLIIALIKEAVSSSSSWAFLLKY